MLERSPHLYHTLQADRVEILAIDFDEVGIVGRGMPGRRQPVAEDRPQEQPQPREATLKVSGGRQGYGLLCPGRPGRSALHRAAGQGLWTGRPVFGQQYSTVGLFKVSPDGREAVRTQVRLGRTSVTAVEIVSGLERGDIVITSDMSAWDDADRVRLR